MTMKAHDLKEKTKEELAETLQEKRARIEELTFLLSQKKVKNVKELREAKKDVARVLTILNRK